MPTKKEYEEWAREQYLAAYPPRNSPFSNAVVPDFKEYLEAAYDAAFLREMGIAIQEPTA